MIGRFVSADVLVPDQYDPQDFNRYSYVRNNPLIYVDPNGHHYGSNEPGGFADFGGETVSGKSIDSSDFSSENGYNEKPEFGPYDDGGYKKSGPPDQGGWRGYFDPQKSYDADKNLQRISKLDPDMVMKAVNVYQHLKKLGYKPTVVETLRTLEEQKAKVRKGYSKTLKSKHLDQGKGAKAMDVVDERHGWDDSKKEAQDFFNEYGKAAKEQGLIWGGDWGRKDKKKGYGWDPAHVEMP